MRKSSKQPAAANNEDEHTQADDDSMPNRTLDTTSPAQVTEQPIPQCDLELEEQPLNEPIQEEPSEPPKKKRKTNSNSTSVDNDDPPSYLEESEYTSAIEELCLEMALPKPRPKKIKQHLLNTFSNRRRWITESFPPVSEVLNKYPCFREQRWVSFSNVYTWKYDYLLYICDMSIMH